jgi:hypothetical protein
VCQRDDSDALALQPLESKGVIGPFTETGWGGGGSMLAASAILLWED